MLMDKKIAVITGGSSGIGLATAACFHAHGYKVYSLSRSAGTLAGINHIPCDVSSEEQIQAAIDKVLEEEGQIDVCIANAGFGISGSLEGTKEQDALHQIDINFHGALRLSQAALPALRESKGRLIAVSSVAGTIPIPYQALYSASKAALQSAFLALDNEIRGARVRALTVLPGDTATPFTDNRVPNVSEPDIYREKATASVDKMAADERSGKSPETVARVIYRLATRKNPPPQTVVGFSYKLLSLLYKIMPLRLGNWAVGKLYS